MVLKEKEAVLGSGEEAELAPRPRQPNQPAK
jgi:hypothetical protein